MQRRSLTNKNQDSHKAGIIDKTGIVILLIVILAAGGYDLGHATGTMWSNFRTTYPAAATALASDCRICHVSPSGGGTRTSYGNAYRTANHSFSAIEPLDSDGDGYTNLAEITALTWPQDATSHPTSDTTAPTVTAFAIPASATSLTVAISTFTATDTVGVTGYLVTETATAPAAGATGWAASAPANYTFASEGAKTLYAWAKDAAGNVSAALSAAVTVTLPDTTAPNVTAFALPATATSLAVTITTFTATDNKGVTGYLVTETASAPAAGATGWTASAPATYTFATEGAKTLYAWAKDAAGNVSAALSAAVTVTLPDTTAPTVTAFALPATATSLTVTITAFTATDNKGVTGYLVTETASAPLASATGWGTSAPATYTFVTEGAKTLYAWAKDAAGNVSSALSAAVTVTLPDTTAPTVTAFAIPATATSLTVTITTFTALDNKGITGYLVTETATAPTAGVAGWTASAPANYTFATEGAKTLYAWAKDAAGNVSSALSAAVTVTLINNTPGTIQGSVSISFAGHSNLGVANATISLKGTNFTAATDADGKFILTSIPPGNYQIVAFSPEIAPTQQQITLAAGATLQVNLSATAPLRGDANGDNRLDIGDVIYLLQLFSGVR